MDLTSKQRAQLRGLANSIDTILHVGKDGIGDNLVKQADDALEAVGRMPDVKVYFILAGKDGAYEEYVSPAMSALIME